MTGGSLQAGPPTDAVHDLELRGCTPEPLMAYLKALGILRLVSEQADPAARGWWRNDAFWLRTTLDHDAMLRFFLEEYKPTPILVPWTGSDFFGVNAEGNAGPFAKTPTATAIIEAFLASTTDRLEQYRDVIKATLAGMKATGVAKKEDIDSTKGKAAKQRKVALFAYLRQSLDDDVVTWIDAAGICAEDLRFSSLLGSGGGSDGNTHFSDNFMQNLWDMLPDFDSQRKAKRNQEPPRAVDSSGPCLRSALCEDGVVQLIHKRTSSLYDSGAVGGPNATQGMERDSLANPWNVILALEGTLAFTGAAAKRLGANVPADAAFPFQVSAVATNSDGLADKERAGSEVWLPLWNRPAGAEEVLTLLREGRAQCGERTARSGVDMARAAATLGIDRGVDVFCRYAIVKGRVGGENYNTAASLGRFQVRERSEADLLRQIDPWLDRFRSACSADPPPRFGRALRAIDSAVFDFCRYGGKPLFQKILIALGQAERELALTPGKVGQSKFPPGPLAGLSRHWIAAADDRSAEFAVARALAGVRHEPDNPGEQPKVGPLRANFEPVEWEKKRCRAWAEKDRAVVWNAADLPTNLVAVLARRIMDGDREGCENLPLASPASAPLSAIAEFIAGDMDDRWIEDLLWGLVLVNPSRHQPNRDDNAEVPAAYALLKLLSLPQPLVVERGPDGRVSRARLRQQDEPKERGIRIRPEPRIMHLLRAGRLGEACAVAMRRLRATGLAPMPRARTGRTRDGDWQELDRMGTAGIDPIRLAAALLIPISDRAVSRLVTLITRPEDIDAGLDTEHEPAGSLAAGD